MTDPRVLHFWDGNLQTGQWFAKAVDGYTGIAWDVYYLYGSDAAWETIPAPLIVSGGTIYYGREMLKTQLLMLLKQ